jgi:hypothetical protein
MILQILLCALAPLVIWVLFRVSHSPIEPRAETMILTQVEPQEAPMIFSPKQFFDRPGTSEREARLVAFLAGNHPRCGIDSPLLQLPHEVMKWTIDTCNGFSPVRRHRHPNSCYARSYKMTMTTIWGTSEACYNGAGDLCFWTYYDFYEFYVENSDWTYSDSVELKLYKLHNLETTPMIRIVQGRQPGSKLYVRYNVSDVTVNANMIQEYREGWWEVCPESEPASVMSWILPVFEWIKWRISQYSADLDGTQVNKFIRDLREESGFPPKIAPPDPWPK